MAVFDGANPALGSGQVADPPRTVTLAARRGHPRRRLSIGSDERACAAGIDGTIKVG